MRTISLLNDRTFIATRAGAVLVALAIPLLSTVANAQEPEPAPAPAPANEATVGVEERTTQTTTTTTSPPPAATTPTTTGTPEVTYVERDATVVRDTEDDDRDEDARRFRLSIESEMLGGAWFDPEGAGNSSVSLGFGLARPSLLDGSGTVVMQPLIALGLGYVFAENRAVVGAKLGFSVDAYDLDEGSNDNLVTFGGRLVPYFQWIFLPDRKIRPYFEARAGFGGSTRSSRDRNGDVGRVTRSFIYPVVGGGLGLHMFPRDYFSVDLGLNVDYAPPFSQTTRSEGPDDDWDKEGDLVNYGLMLGVSTWF